MAISLNPNTTDPHEGEHLEYGLWLTVDNGPCKLLGAWKQETYAKRRAAYLNKYKSFEAKVSLAWVKD